MLQAEDRVASRDPAGQQTLGPRVQTAIGQDAAEGTNPLKTHREPEDRLLVLKGHPPVAGKGTAGLAPSLSLELRG